MPSKNNSNALSALTSATAMSIAMAVGGGYAVTSILLQSAGLIGASALMVAMVSRYAIGLRWRDAPSEFVFYGGLTFFFMALTAGVTARFVDSFGPDPGMLAAGAAAIVVCAGCVGRIAYRKLGRVNAVLAGSIAGFLSAFTLAFVITMANPDRWML